jgi:hypothetical protein
MAKSTGKKMKLDVSDAQGNEIDITSYVSDFKFELDIDLAGFFEVPAEGIELMISGTVEPTRPICGPILHMVRDVVFCAN